MNMSGAAETKDTSPAGGPPPISVGVINYNGREIVGRTLESIFASDYPDIEVVMVDDCSTDDSVAFVRERFPEVRVCPQPRNMGLNAGRNRAMAEVGRDIVFITDNDVEFEPDALRLLVEAMTADPQVGMATPMILDSEDKNRIYSNGASLHYACFAIIPHRYVPVPPDMDWRPRVTVVGSGGMMLLRREANDALGGFDEDFNHGYTEGEYSLRMTASGWKVVQVPMAKLYHIERSRRNPKKLRFQIRSRWDLILKTYSARTLVLIGPALFMFELSQIFFLLAKGALGEWLRGVGAVVGSFGRIMAKRRAFMKIKKRRDGELLTSGEIYMFPHRMGGGPLTLVKRAFEGALNAYWRLVRPLL